MKRTHEEINLDNHNSKIIASVDELVDVLGVPRIIQRLDENDYKFEWDYKSINNGSYYTIYGWSLYITSTEKNYWNISGFHFSEMELTEVAEEINYTIYGF